MESEKLSNRQMESEKGEKRSSSPSNSSKKTAGLDELQLGELWAASFPLPEVPNSPNPPKAMLTTNPSSVTKSEADSQSIPSMKPTNSQMNQKKGHKKGSGDFGSGNNIRLASLSKRSTMTILIESVDKPLEFHDLPISIQVEIFGLLNWGDIIRVVFVCQAWRKVVLTMEKRLANSFQRMFAFVPMTPELTSALSPDALSM